MSRSHELGTWTASSQVCRGSASGLCAWRVGSCNHSQRNFQQQLLLNGSHQSVLLEQDADWFAQWWKTQSLPKVCHNPHPASSGACQYLRSWQRLSPSWFQGIEFANSHPSAVPVHWILESPMRNPRASCSCRCPPTMIQCQASRNPCSCNWSCSKDFQRRVQRHATSLKGTLRSLLFDYYDSWSARKWENHQSWDSASLLCTGHSPGWFAHSCGRCLRPQGSDVSPSSTQCGSEKLCHQQTPCPPAFHHSQTLLWQSSCYFHDAEQLCGWLGTKVPSLSSRWWSLKSVAMENVASSGSCSPSTHLIWVMWWKAASGSVGSGQQLWLWWNWSLGRPSWWSFNPLEKDNGNTVWLSLRKSVEGQLVEPKAISAKLLSKSIPGSNSFNSITWPCLSWSESDWF